MSDVLDQILERVERFGIRNAWVLFVHLEEKVPWAPNSSVPWRKVLLYRHSADPMEWGLPGGLIADDESPQRAAQRWAETQTGMACGAFTDSLDIAGGRVFIAPVHRERLELERATTPETFWTHSDFPLSCPSSVIHPAARAALERVDDLILTNPTQGDTMSTNRSDFIAAQVRASAVLAAFGDSAGASAVMQGESLIGYKARLVQPFLRYCAPEYQKVDLTRINDENAFSYIEGQIFDAAEREAKRPTALSLRPGEVRTLVTKDPSGRELTRYIAADDGAVWDRFAPPVRYIRRLLTPGVGRVS